jgi:hypothetical protein
MGRGASSLVDRLHAAACLVTANFACRADVFRELGGFAPEYLRDEDREFNLRMWRAGKRGMYVDSVVTFTEVQHERLEKRYHRAWHRVTGASHARMHRDTITRDGVLDDAMTSGGWAFGGVPGFLLREWMTHARNGCGIGRGSSTWRFSTSAVRYLSSYGDAMARGRWRAPVDGSRHAAQTTHQRMMNNDELLKRPQKP